MKAKALPRFERLAAFISRSTGRTGAFVAALSAVAALRGASNRLVNVEDLGEDELLQLHVHYAGLAELARRERGLKVRRVS